MTGLAIFANIKIRGEGANSANIKTRTRGDRWCHALASASVRRLRVGLMWRGSVVPVSMRSLGTDRSLGNFPPAGLRRARRPEHCVQYAQQLPGHRGGQGRYRTSAGRCFARLRAPHPAGAPGRRDSLGLCTFSRQDRGVEQIHRGLRKADWLSPDEAFTHQPVARKPRFRWLPIFIPATVVESRDSVADDLAFWYASCQPRREASAGSLIVCRLTPLSQS